MIRTPHAQATLLSPRQLCLVAARKAPPGASHPGLSPPPESETAHVASAGRIEEQGKSDADIIDTDARERKVAPLHPLLFDSCRCKRSTTARCMACTRWTRHYGMVSKRRKTWGVV